VVQNNLEDLNTFAELRNCIVHNRDGQEQMIAEPSDDITKAIEQIAELLQEDHNMLRFASSPVTKAEYSEPVIDVLTQMDQSNNAKVPVYDNGTFKGIFSLQQVLHHMLTHDRTQLGNVSDIFDEATKGRVIFVSRATLLEEVAQMFDRKKFAEARPTVLLVTETGGTDEDPLGIITLSDLAQIVNISV